VAELHNVIRSDLDFADNQLVLGAHIKVSLRIVLQLSYCSKFQQLFSGGHQQNGGFVR